MNGTILPCRNTAARGIQEVKVRKLDPRLASDQMRATGLEPLEPYPGSAKKWHCRCLVCDQEVWPRHSSVKQGQGGCNFCAQKAAHVTQTLSQSEATAAMRAAGLEPLEPYESSNSPWLCRCTVCGVERHTRHSSVQQGHGCKSCEMEKAAKRRRLSNAANAVLTMQSAGLEPLEPYPGTVRKWRCTCMECGQTVVRTHDKVQQSGSGCPLCSIIRRGLNHRVDEEVAVSIMRTAGLEPLEPYPTTLLPWPCRCEACGRTVDPSLASVKSGTRCRYCSGKDVIPEEAVEVMRAAGVEPLEPYPGANAGWLCKCGTCGRHPQPSYGFVRKTGNACGYCAGRHVDPDEAMEVMLGSGFQPLKPYPGSLTAWPSECVKCGKKSSPQYANVKYGGTRCAYCQGRRTDPEEAAEEMRSAGLEPLVPYPGANTPWACRCTTCQQKVTPVIGSVRAGSGCRYCATKGLNYNEPALLYLVTHPELEAHKVGIGSPTAGRLDAHRKYGWNVYKVIAYPTGQEAYEVESAVLRWIRLEMGFPQALAKEDMPQRGETETLYSSDIDLPILWREITRISLERQQCLE